MDTHTFGVLKQLERGEIDIDQANARLDESPLERVEPMFKPELPGWIRWLRNYLLISGTLIVLFGAWIIVSTVHANVLWLVLGLPIVLLGALLLSLGGMFYALHWVCVNIEQTHGHPRVIRFALPVPFGLIRAGLWIAARFIRRDSRHGFWYDPDELFHALERELKEGRGITVDVDDKGQRMQLYWIESNESRSTTSGPGNSSRSGSRTSGQKETRFLFEHGDKMDSALKRDWAGY